MAEQVGKADKDPRAEVKMCSPQREARGRGARAMGRAVGLIGLSSIIISSAVVRSDLRVGGKVFLSCACNRERHRDVLGDMLTTI